MKNFPLFWAILATLVAVIAYSLAFYQYKGGTITVSAFELVDRIVEAEGEVNLLGASQNDTLKEIAKLRQHMGNLSNNHNNLARAMSQTGQSQQNNLLVLNRALSRMHGKPDWEAAMAGARAELEEEANKAKGDSLKALDDAAAEAKAPEGPEITEFPEEDVEPSEDE